MSQEGSLCWQCQQYAAFQQTLDALFFAATYQNCVDCLFLLFKQGKRPWDGNNLARIAAEYHHKEVVFLLMDQGYLPDFDSVPAFPLTYRLRCKSLAACRLAQQSLARACHHLGYSTQLRDVLPTILDMVWATRTGEGWVEYDEGDTKHHHCVLPGDE